MAETEQYYVNFFPVKEIVKQGLLYSNVDGIAGHKPKAKRKRLLMKRCAAMPVMSATIYQI